MGEAGSARGLEMLFNFFQYALVARRVALATVIVQSARAHKRRGKIHESMITRGIMRVGV